MPQPQLPTLGQVPSSFNAPLNVKLTHTGVIFLGYFQEKKYISERSYRKRYAGSKTCAVDINGNMWLNGKLHAEAVEQSYKQFKGIKKVGSHPDRKNNVNNICQPQISEDNPDCANNTTEKPEKKIRSYGVNKKEVRHRILQFVNTQAGKKQLFFWTVSFPAGTQDNVCYQAFNTWLTSLRKYNMLQHYIWVAERQDGKRIEDGRKPTHTLHFHIAIPHFLSVQRANAMMRGTLKNLARKGKLPVTAHSTQIKNYNGVDIAKHRNTKRVINFAIKKGARALATYLSKYVSKNDEKFSHFAWHNSRAFSALFTSVAFTLSEFVAHNFHAFLNRTRVMKMEFATFIPWLHGPPPTFESHLASINDYVIHKLFNI